MNNNLDKENISGSFKQAGLILLEGLAWLATGIAIGWLGRNIYVLLF